MNSFISCLSQSKSVSPLVFSPLRFSFSAELHSQISETKNSPQGTESIFKSMMLDQSKLTPKEVVSYLDRFVIGQSEAKKAVAISFRNRWRRKALAEEIRAEISPKNLLIQGPTGSGKTEIARRLAKLTDAPFLRVEATKYTEVGYVGKDVTTIVQDLAKVAVNNFRAKFDKYVQDVNRRVSDEVYSQILDAMIGDEINDTHIIAKKLKDLKQGFYNEQVVTIMANSYKPKILTELQDFSPPQKSLTREVKELYSILYDLYKDKMKKIYENIDIQKEALRNVEEEGIVFIDEIDKLAVSEGPSSLNGKGVSTEGVQRDLLPIIEGTTVNTKYGDIKTDHILFIASGSFSMAKVDDLIPELLGRLPIKVKLQPINEEELERILREPEFNLLFQQEKLLATENIKLEFQSSAVKQIAKAAFAMNSHSENLGARRLQSIVEKVVEEVSFSASEIKKQGSESVICVDEQFVNQRLKGFWQQTDLRSQLI